MALNRKYFYKKYREAGSSMMEVILAIALVLAVTPFLYGQISSMTEMVQDIHYAKKIVAMRNNIITFMRVNESDWGQMDEPPKITPEQIKEIAPGAKNMIVDNQSEQTGVMDVYVVFPRRKTNLRTAKVAKYIGSDAAVVQHGGIAYAQNWAVQDEKNFEEGDLIFRVSRDYALENKTKYLHREAGVKGDLTTMLTNLHMNNNYMYNVGEMSGKYIDMHNSIATKVRCIQTDNNIDYIDDVRFLGGVNITDSYIYAENVSYVNTLYGLNIEAAEVNNNKDPLIIGRDVTISNSVSVGNDLILKYNENDTSVKTVLDISFLGTQGLSSYFINASNLIYTTNEKELSESSFGITVASNLWPISKSVKGLSLGKGNEGFWNISDGPIPTIGSVWLKTVNILKIIPVQMEITEDIKKNLKIAW